MPCLRRNPKHTAAYEAYLDERRGKLSTSDKNITFTIASSTPHSQPPAFDDESTLDKESILTQASSTPPSPPPAIPMTNNNELNAPKLGRPYNAPKAMAQTTSKATKPTRRLPMTNDTKRTTNARLRRKQGQQLPTLKRSPRAPLRRAPSWHLYGKPTIKPGKQAKPTKPPRKPTPPQRAAKKHKKELKDKHRRMGITAWCGPKHHGAMHLQRMHEYVSRGWNPMMNKMEMAEDKAALRAVGVVIPGL